MVKKCKKDELCMPSLLPVSVLSASVLLGCPIQLSAQPSGVERTKVQTVPVADTLQRLIEETGFSPSDTCKIRDLRKRWEQLGDNFCFQVTSDGGTPLKLTDPYHKSVLFQILKRAELAGHKEIGIKESEIYENPVRRLSGLIKHYWHGLTRRIDKEHLSQILEDSKTSSGKVQYLYVPHDDTEAYIYFSQAAKDFGGRLKVERLPKSVTPEFVKGLEGKHGLLSLAIKKTESGGYRGVPFVVPGGRFNEMYGWDSYFILKGLIVDGEIELAKAMVDNFVYQLEHYGKILNANRSYYLTRSQPPFITSMIRETYAQLPKNNETKAWLERALKAAIKEYWEVWTAPSRTTPIGLNRYHGSGTGPSPEVEPGHFNHIFVRYAKRRGMDPKLFEEKYRNGSLKDPALDQFFVHDRACRESGHDTTFRWEDRCSDFAPVELNCLIYQMEIDIARIIKDEFGGLFDGQKASFWSEKAVERRERIDTYLWDDERKLFFDYDFVFQKRMPYESATTLFPLWAGHDDDPQTRLLSSERAERLLESALPFLEMAGGIASSSEKSRGPLTQERPARQWEFPNGWAPHQMVIWKGCLQYGFKETAHRLVYKWLYTIAKNAKDHNGMVPEKFDVVARSHEVFAEYGNVGADFDYITEEGFGWVNASFQLGLEILKNEASLLHGALEDLTTPEEVFRILK